MQNNHFKSINFQLIWTQTFFAILFSEEIQSQKSFQISNLGLVSFTYFISQMLTGGGTKGLVEESSVMKICQVTPIQ